MSADETKEDNYTLTAAIDFGTTYSGYGFSRQNKINDIIVNKEWKTEVYKTPTTVLINDKGEFVSFGFEAEKRYSQMKKDELQKHDLFKHFKMMLYHEKNLTRLTTIKSVTGRSHTALDIFAMSMTYLKRFLLDQVKQQDGGVPQNEHIKWVLTIPAIWNDQAKQFMREAAEKAGLITSKNPKQLVLALEPEAASVFFRNIEVNHFTEVPIDVMETSIIPGTKYMTIDAGGGTIDITVHEILDDEDNNIKELIPATGMEWGGNEINNKFENLLYKILGEKFMNALKQDHPKIWLNLQNTFETAKRELDISMCNEIHLNAPYGIDSAYEKSTNGNLEKDINKLGSSYGVSFNDESIVLSEECVEKLFDSVINKTVDKVKDILEHGDVGTLKYIILAGGFGESKNFYNRINEEFKKSAIVISPVSAGLSIIKGALLFAYNPSLIKVRRMRRTYGYGVNLFFIENVHDTSRKFTDESGEVRCRNCFDTFVEKNDCVELNSVKQIFTCPAKKEQTAIPFVMYSTDSVGVNSDPENGVKYDNDKRLKIIGQLLFDIPPVPPEDEDTRESEIRVKFGGTEIEVEVCTTTANGTEKKALSIDLLKDYENIQPN